MDHNFGQPSLSPTDYFNNGTDLNPPLQPGPRSYKSRKYRPCDFCRARQVACKIDISPPCALCRSHSRECTFVERPKKKRRPNVLLSNGEPSRSGAPAPMQQFDVATTQMSPGFIAQYNNEQSYSGLESGHEGLDTQQASPNGLHQLVAQTQDGSPIYNMDPYLHMISGGGVRIRPLDSPTTRSARFIGETGESNPYLLRHYAYDENDECTISKITYRRIKSLPNPNSISGQTGEPPVVFMLADDSLAQKGEPRVEDEILSKAQSDITSMFSNEQALRLISLFFKFVNPYFPILSKTTFYTPSNTLIPTLPQTLPLSLLSSIYATSLPFILYDSLLATTLIHCPPDPYHLFRISWQSITHELHTPRLSTLQSCLLLLQRAPTNRYTTDTPWKTSLIGWTVSLAQILGLTKECSSWSSIPTYEITLRKRLWYAVYIMDKWASLGAGMPSHIFSDDVDVLPLVDSDLEISGLGISGNNQNQQQQQELNPDILPEFLEPLESDYGHFKALVELTEILSDIMASFYTIQATKRTARNFLLSVEIAEGFRERLKMWNEGLREELVPRCENSGGIGGVDGDGRGMVRLSGNWSLGLAVLTVQITLWRAMLRPLENLRFDGEDGSGGDGNGEVERLRGWVREGARGCGREVVEFLEGLGRGALDGFWHSWSRANFAIASSFLMQLLVSSQTAEEEVEIHALVERWRWGMRVGGGNGVGGGLMSLGLLRLDGLLLESGSLRPVGG